MALRRKVLVVLGFLTLFWDLPARAGEIYQYTGANGVVHFSNVPTDRRFRPLEQRAPAPASVRSLEQTIRSAAREFQVDPDLVKAVIKVESDFDANAVSWAGAMGLMQLMPDTAAMHSVADPFNPTDNIRGGARHLAYLLGRFGGDLPLSLAAYHAGATTVERHALKIPPIDETRKYVKKVLEAYKKYRGPDRRRGLYRVITADGSVIYTNAPESYRSAGGYVVAYVK
jgi:soluble lytic murein transglycosylase-like protein